MPPLTPEQEDTLFEAISKQLYRLNKIVKGLFGQELTDDELRQAHGRVSAGVNQAIQQQRQPRRVPPPTPQPAVPRHINPADLVEGGFINDQSGEATALIRRQQGIP